MELKDPGIGVEGSRDPGLFQLLLNSSPFISLPSYSSPKSTPRKRALKLSFIQLPKRKPRRFNAQPWVQPEQHTSPPFLRRLVDSLPRTLEDGTPLSKWRRRVPNQFKNLLVG